MGTKAASVGLKSGENSDFRGRPVQLRFHASCWEKRFFSWTKILPLTKLNHFVCVFSYRNISLTRNESGYYFSVIYFKICVWFFLNGKFSKPLNTNVVPN